MTPAVAGRNCVEFQGGSQAYLWRSAIDDTTSRFRFDAK